MRALAAFALISLMAGCAPPPAKDTKAAAPALKWDEIKALVTPLTYRDVLVRKCGMPDARPLAPFMAELKAAGASAEVLAQADGEAARIATEEKDTELEYICTVELMESTEKKADAALKAWAEIKARRP